MREVTVNWDTTGAMRFETTASDGLKVIVNNRQRPCPLG